jgi:hypothetical protein
MRQFATLLGFFLLTLCSAASAEVYKWKDAAGNTHYSDTKPPDGAAAEEVSERLENATSTYSTGKRATKSRVHTEVEPLRPSVVVMKIHQVDYQLARADEKKIRQEIELIYRRYVDWLDWDPRPLKPVSVRLFGSGASFDAYAKNFNREGSRRSFYSSWGKEAVVYGSRWTEETLGILRHEVSHAIVDMELNGPPFWINEGLAEVFESSSAARGRLNVTANREWSGTLKLKVREGSLEPWGRYVDIDNDQWRRAGARTERSYYMIAWSMMSYLLSSQGGRRCLRDVMEQGRTRGFGALSKMFERHCGLNRLDREWREWITRL